MFVLLFVLLLSHNQWHSADVLETRLRERGKKSEFQRNLEKLRSVSDFDPLPAPLLIVTVHGRAKAKAGHIIQ
jgi:hypothetical protein